MNFEKIYKDQLDEVRQQPDRLADYAVELKTTTPLNHNQAPRLRLLIALFNDLKDTDYHIVRFLFEEELQLRKTVSANDEYDVDVFYLAAFLLVHYQKTDDFWKFIDAKFIDFDTGLGFDSEFLLAFGIEKVYTLLQTTHHSLREQAVKILGTDRNNCWCSEADLELWREGKKQYFAVFQFPVKNIMAFASNAKEKLYLRQHLQQWANDTNNWTEDDFMDFIYRSRMIGNTHLEKKALSLYLAHFPESVRTDFYLRDLKMLTGEGIGHPEKRGLSHFIYKIRCFLDPDLPFRCRFDETFRYLRSVYHQEESAQRKIYRLLKMLHDDMPEHIAETLLRDYKSIAVASNTNGVFAFCFPIVSHILYYKPALEKAILGDIVGPNFANGTDDAGEMIAVIQGAMYFAQQENPGFLTPEGQFWVENILPGMTREVQREIEKCRKEVA